MSEKLKPCPFCGKKAQHRTASFGEDLVRARCSVCAVATDYYPNNDYPSAYKKWNTRPIEDALKAERDGLEDKLNQLETESHDATREFQHIVNELSELKAENERMRAALEDAQKWVFNFRDQPEDNDAVLEQYRTNCRRVQKIISEALEVTSEYKTNNKTTGL